MRQKVKLVLKTSRSWDEMALRGWAFSMLSLGRLPTVLETREDGLLVEAEISQTRRTRAFGKHGTQVLETRYSDGSTVSAKLETP